MLHSISCSQRSFVHVEFPSQLKQPKTTFWFSGIEGMTLTNHSPWFPLEGGSFLKPGRAFPEHQQRGSFVWSFSFVVQALGVSQGLDRLRIIYGCGFV